MNDEEERKRILEMVESGRISAAEGVRLMDTAEKDQTAGSMICPYCAESIPRTSIICPECSSNLAVPKTASTTSSGFQTLSGLGKFLVVYTLLVSSLKLLSLFHSFGVGAIAGALLSALGLETGIMILKDRPIGWVLGILWSALQIVCVIVGGQIINQMIFHLGTTFYVEGQGWGVNLVGVVLLILFIKAKPVIN